MLCALSDLTSQIQSAISEACQKNRIARQGTEDFVSVRLEKGDYGIISLLIPKNSKVLLYSKDRVRLLYLGKRNRPMFVLEENSVLVIKERVEIYYNSNNLQEVSKLMMKVPESSRVEMSHKVKVSLFSLKT